MLRVMEFLMRESDEEHIRSADDILRYLESCNIDANIKTVNDDIKVLQEFGIDVIKVKGKGGGSYIGSRNLELPELKLLTDAVKISKFITTKKSEHLINKLKSLTSKGQAEQLSRDIYLQDAVKTGNENIYYNVDCIHTAILKNKEVSFKYNEWTLEKKLKPKNQGMKYVVSPWELTWSDENYYLVGYEEKTGKLYRKTRCFGMKTRDILSKSGRFTTGIAADRSHKVVRCVTIGRKRFATPCRLRHLP